MNSQLSYLIRFDDVCPTMNWRVWKPLASILIEHGVQPLIAVVPDNQDPQLRVDAANPDFWKIVRGWQAHGWTIGLHGYQHSYVTRQAGLMGRAHKSEFAGLPAEAQLDRVRRGVSILNNEGLDPPVWIAPGHSFDRTTIDVLRATGIHCVSDGYTTFPYKDNSGMFWIPQQLTAFVPKRRGVWTVCLHPNGWTPEDLKNFEGALRAHRPLVRTVQHIFEIYKDRRAGWGDSVAAALWGARYRVRMTMRGL